MENKYNYKGGNFCNVYCVPILYSKNNFRLSCNKVVYGSTNLKISFLPLPFTTEYHLIENEQESLPHKELYDKSFRLHTKALLEKLSSE